MDMPTLSTAQLRVLSHPMRIAFLRRLRGDGPATARMLGREFDLDSGAASYHLRRLAAGDIIAEDTTLGTRRERWWRAVDDQLQSAPAADGNPADARGHVRSTVLGAAEELRRVAATVPDASAEWLADAAFVDLRLPLDHATRRALLTDLMAVIDRYRPTSAPDSPGALTEVQLQIYERP